MVYLETTDYEAFGLPASLTADWVTVASAVIDLYCRRDSLGVTEYTERLRFTSGSDTVQLTYAPLTTVLPASSPLLNVQGRLSRPRRGESWDPMQELVCSTFQAPGAWVTLDPTQLDWSPEGTLTVLRGLFAPAYNEVNVTYTAGLSEIPNAVKTACALIIKNAQSTTGLNVKSSRVDMLQVQYFSDSLIDSTVRTLLRPWLSTKLG